MPIQFILRFLCAPSAPAPNPQAKAQDQAAQTELHVVQGTRAEGQTGQSEQEPSPTELQLVGWTHV